MSESESRSQTSPSPRPGQNLVSDATFRSVLEMEMGSFGRATAETRSRSPVVVRILHFRMVGCFSPTGHRQGSEVRGQRPAISWSAWRALLTDWRAVLEDVVDRKSLLPQGPTLHDAAALIGRTQQHLQHTHTDRQTEWRQCSWWPAGGSPGPGLVPAQSSPGSGT